MWYACPKRDLGAELELSFRGETLGAKAVRAVDPPLLTGFDRKPRVEGYVKFFEPMNLGRMRLSKGKGELRLQAKNTGGAGLGIPPSDVPAGGSEKG